MNVERELALIKVHQKNLEFGPTQQHMKEQAMSYRLTGNKSQNMENGFILKAHQLMEKEGPLGTWHTSENRACTSHRFIPSLNLL